MSQDKTYVGGQWPFKVNGVNGAVMGYLLASGEPLFVNVGFKPTEIELYCLGAANANPSRINARMIWNEALSGDLGEDYSNFNPFDFSLLSEPQAGSDQALTMDVVSNKPSPYGEQKPGEDLMFEGICLDSRGFWVGANSDLQADPTIQPYEYTLDLDTPSGGTFELSDRGVAKEIAHDANDAAIKAALEDIYGDGNVASVDSGTITLANRVDIANLQFDGENLDDASGASLTETEEFSFTKAATPTVLAYVARR